MVMTKEQEKKRKKFMEERREQAKAGKEIELTSKEKAKTSEGREKFVSGRGRVTNQEFKQEKAKTGTPNDPALARREQRQISQIAETPEQFGFLPEQQPSKQDTTSMPDRSSQAPDMFSLQGVSNLIKGKDVQLGDRTIKTGLGERDDVLAGTVPIGFNVGGVFIANLKRVVQAGNAAKTSGIVSNLISRIKKFPLISAAAGAIAVKSVSGFLDKVGEQQQALNTVGQVTSTIVGQSTSAAGDWRQGLKELDRLEQQVLELERKIKAGQIASATIRVDGRIVDINADIQDQLKTISEGRTDIRSFVLEGQFPDMTPFEIQSHLRKLEDEGFIEPINVEATRR